MSSSYVPNAWADGDASRPLSAARLTRMETQADVALADVEAQISDPETPIGGALLGTFVSLAAAAKNPDLLITGAITRNGSGVVTSAVVLWPDGVPGVFTTDTIDATGAINAYNITHVNGAVTRTYTQPAITRNASGAATNVPQIVVN